MKKITSKFIATVMCIAVSMMTLAGCGDSTEETTNESVVTSASQEESSSAGEEKADEGTAEYETEMHIALNSAPPTLDTMQSTEQFGRIMMYGTVYESLMTMDENYEPKEELAESIEVNEDCSEYIYHLRQGVLFHNGQEMKAEDVAASMNRWIELYGAAAKMVGDARFEVVDDYTVKISMDKPALFLNYLIANQTQGAIIVPKTAIDNQDASTGYLTEYIGTGPYKFDEWVDDQYVKLTKFDGYVPYGTEGEMSGWCGYKAAYLQNIYFEFVPDDTTRANGVLSGEYDMVYSLPIDSYEMFEGNTDVKIYTEPGGLPNLVFNKKDGLASNPLIRQAINYALNADEIMQVSYANEEFYKVYSSYMPEERPLWYSEAGAEYFNQQDIEKAQELLEKAGYNGETFRIIVSSDYSDYVNTALTIENQLEAIGMNVQVDTYDWATFATLRNDETAYDGFCISPMVVPIPTMLIYLNPEWAGWTSDKYIVSTVEAINSATSVEEAASLWNELQEYCSKDYLPHISFGVYYSCNVASSDLEGFEYFNGPWVVNTKVPKK